MTQPSEHLIAYRRTVREWLAANVPPNWREQVASLDHDQQLEWERRWLRTLHSGGYAIPHWPRELGGADATMEEQLILHEEMARADAPVPHLFTVSLYHAGMTIASYGTDEQRRRHLPPIQEGEIWCQGFSEPGAGSDLASLSCRAVRDGDHYVVNGQKVWSSYSAIATWCILLARTDPEAPKRRGISFFLMDMSSPGIEVRPIKQLTGNTEFCEIFLTDVRVPAENLVGAEGDGWKIAQFTLSTERGVLSLGLVEQLRRAIPRLAELARSRRGLAGATAAEDGAVRQELAATYAEAEVLAALSSRLLGELARKGGAGAEASVVKVAFSELLQRLTELAVRLEGLPAHRAGARPHLFEVGQGSWLLNHLGSWAWTIAAGTNEIQRNVIAERILGLPRDPLIA